MADNATLVRSLIEAWNERDFDYFTHHITPETEIVDVGSGTTFRGPEGVRQYNTMWAEAFPDGRITIDHVYETGDTVVVEYTGRGTHTGPLVTGMGTIAPTGKSLTMQLCDVNVLADGKLLRQRSYFDTGSMMAQLGLMPASSTTTTT